MILLTLSSDTCHRRRLTSALSVPTADMSGGGGRPGFRSGLRLSHRVQELRQPAGPVGQHERRRLSPVRPHRRLEGRHVLHASGGRHRQQVGSATPHCQGRCMEGMGMFSLGNSLSADGLQFLFLRGTRRVFSQQPTLRNVFNEVSSSVVTHRKSGLKFPPGPDWTQHAIPFSPSALDRQVRRKRRRRGIPSRRWRLHLLPRPGRRRRQQDQRARPPAAHQSLQAAAGAAD